MIVLSPKRYPSKIRYCMIVCTVWTGASFLVICSQQLWLCVKIWHMWYNCACVYVQWNRICRCADKLWCSFLPLLLMMVWFVYWWISFSFVFLVFKTNSLFSYYILGLFPGLLDEYTRYACILSLAKEILVIWHTYTHTHNQAKCYAKIHYC